jgi:hypothetical protein
MLKLGGVIFLQLIAQNSAFFLAKNKYRSLITFNNKNSFEGELESLKIDISKLDPSEQDRLRFIQKLTNEADEFAKLSGLLPSDDLVEKAVIDTNWSGQSSVDQYVASQNNFDDLLSRKGLALGDILSFLIFSAIGRSNHSEGLNLFDIISTSSPFIFSWILISPFLGAYNRKATATFSTVYSQIIPGWSVSLLLALTIRGLVKEAIPPPPFILVSAISTYVILTSWRSIYVYLFGGTSDKEYRSSGVFEIFKMIGTLVKRW